MIKELLLASHNAHKKAEYQYIFDQYDIKIIGLDDLKYTGEMPIEDGKDFEENAYIKAEYFYDIYRMPTIADDSGLCIRYLNDFPGIHSARFASHLKNEERNELICTMMHGVEDRFATFYCVICYMDDEDTYYSTGIMDGVIAEKPSGTNGFGYDSIFIPQFEEITLAQMDPEDKNAISHRNLAVCGLGDFLGYAETYE